MESDILNHYMEIVVDNLFKETRYILKHRVF
jgi:hypothetical protein